VQERCKEYVEELYEGKCLLEDNVQTDLQGPSLHLNEFEAALKELKNGKTEGIDGIAAELLKALGSRGKQELFQICCVMYDSMAS